MDILKIPLRNGSMVRYPSSSGLILLATLRIGIPRGHRVSRLLWECRLLYRYLFPFLVKHCHLAQNSKKRTHSLTCVFFCLLYTRFQRGRGTSQNPSTPRGLLWAVAVQCGHGLGFSELNTCYIYKVKQYWSPIIPGETERCRLQKTCSVPPIYCLISRLQTLFFFLFFFSEGTVVIPAARVAEVGVCLIKLSIRRWLGRWFVCTPRGTRSITAHRLTPRSPDDEDS